MDAPGAVGGGWSGRLAEDGLGGWWKMVRVPLVEDGLVTVGRGWPGYRWWRMVVGAGSGISCFATWLASMHTYIGIPEVIIFVSVAAALMDGDT